MDDVRHKRWIGIGGDDPWVRTLRKCRSLRMAVINGGKPGFCAWYGLCVVATAEQMRRLEAWWRRANIRWWKKMPSGAWDVDTSGEPIPWDQVMANVR